MNKGGGWGRWRRPVRRRHLLHRRARQRRVPRRGRHRVGGGVLLEDGHRGRQKRHYREVQLDSTPEMEVFYRVTHLLANLCWLLFGMFHHLEQLLSQFCQFPISPGRTRQRVEHPKSNSTQPRFARRWVSLYMMSERCQTKNRKKSLKQHIKYFNFRSEIQLDHHVQQGRCPCCPGVERSGARAPSRMMEWWCRQQSWGGSRRWESALIG